MEKWCEEVEKLHNLSIKAFTIFSADTYSEWCKYSDALSEEECKNEVEKLYYVLQEESLFIVYSTYRHIFENTKLDIDEECKGLHMKSNKRRTLEMLLNGDYDENKIKKDYSNFIKAFIWLFIRQCAKPDFGNSFNQINDMFNNCNLGNNDRQALTATNLFKETIDSFTSTEHHTDLEKQNALDIAEQTMSIFANVKYTYLGCIFELLNSRFIKHKYKVSFVNYVKDNYDRTFTSIIQEEYNQWKICNCVQVENWKFYEDKIIREYSYTTNNCYRNHDTMCLDLTKKQITALYHYLVSKEYIANDVSAIDFGFALYGKPKDRKLLKKIDWKKSKISLLMLFGGLKNKIKGERYWCKLKNLFTWHEKELGQQGLSGQYERYIKNPPKKENHECEEIKELLLYIKEIKE